MKASRARKASDTRRPIRDAAIRAARRRDSAAKDRRKTLTAVEPANALDQLLEHALDRSFID